LAVSTEPSPPALAFTLAFREKTIGAYSFRTWTANTRYVASLPEDSPAM
jgi:hypothetical protein